MADNVHIPLGPGPGDLLPLAVPHLCGKMLWNHANYQGALHERRSLSQNPVRMTGIELFSVIIDYGIVAMGFYDGNVTSINSTDCTWLFESVTELCVGHGM